MKVSVIINIVLAVALVVAIVIIARGTASSNETVAKDNSNETISSIMSRVSVRAYTEQEVSDEDVETILRAAMAAPSAGNKQPWRFVVVRDRSTLDTIATTFHTMTMTAEAPIAIVVCGDMEATFPGDGLDYWVEDASAATENLLLAAHSLGLGAVWCGIYPMQERVKILSELLDLPGNIIPLNVVPIGYPAEQPAVKDKWQPSYIHYEMWDNTKD